MSFVGLDSIFKPQRVAVVGAGEHTDHVGHVVLRNLLGSGFAGEVYPESPRVCRRLWPPAEGSGEQPG